MERSVRDGGSEEAHIKIELVLGWDNIKGKR